MTEITVIHNGIVFCPEKKTFTKKDLYIGNGYIMDSKDIKSSDHFKKWDAEGNYVSPGFIDMHVHVFENHAKIGIHADKVGINQGVTTLVDAGSTGYNNFEQFKKEIIDKNVTEVLSLLNISSTGLIEGLSELSDSKNLMSETMWKEIKNAEPSIVGLKARMSQSVVGNQGIRPLKYAIKLANQANVPIMAHIGSPPPPLEDILSLLREGDIVTHAFHGKKGGIIDDNGNLIPAAQKALERGVKFDVGHGTSSFSYNTIKRFKSKYSYPFSVSTDIYERNFEQPVGSLMDTISKLLAIGYTLEELLQSVTIIPAQILSLSNYGSLKPGSKADITVFNIVENECILFDSSGEKMMVNQRLIPQATWKNGNLVYQRG
ncbi:amidohydrolase/deacetylase family metallohydrolase [Virgibacillus proomii]|uniref:amidohydrolase/deacetylase family metallohydrolase n=1 Tax=Virgibacillus proomii TaxID=84407 RepID=UPI001C1062B2|nr:amidohydrolase/deacetylase family metallohydrolase [Virgibacillus proomii]MBU5266693.1 amidohydrolase/deacetylase family metallohydrolase [Virgibacillus proomii]